MCKYVYVFKVQQHRGEPLGSVCPSPSPSRRLRLVDTNPTSLGEPVLAARRRCRRASADGLQGRAPSAIGQVGTDGHGVPAEGQLRLERGHGLALRRPQ